MGPSRSGDSWSAVEAYAATQRRAIAGLAEDIRADEPDAVHKLRVACRRLRSTMRTFRPYVDAAIAARLEEELRWLAGELGPARDTEVMAARLRETLADVPPELIIGPVRERLDDTFAAGHALARSAALAALDDARYATLPALIDDALLSAPLVDVDSRGLHARAHQAVRRVDRRLSAASTLAPGEEHAVALHRARKAGKRARYAAEALPELGGADGRALIRSLTALQDALGAHRDAVNAQLAVLDLAGGAHDAGESTFTYGLLHERERAAADSALAGLPAVKKALTDQAARSWLVRWSR